MVFCGVDIASADFRQNEQNSAELFFGTDSAHFVNSVEKIFEQPVVNVSALGMILNGKGEWMIAQTNLLDDVVGRAPGLDFETVRDAIDRLMMRAIHFF